MTSQQEWEKLLCGVIIEGIIYKLKHGNSLTKSQQMIVEKFPDYPWPNKNIEQITSG